MDFLDSEHLTTRFEKRLREMTSPTVPFGFQAEPTDQRRIVIESRDETVVAVPYNAVGAPPSQIGRDKGVAIEMSTLDSDVSDTILAASIAGKRQMGTRDLETMERVVGASQLKMARSQSYTLAKATVGALLGQLRQPNGDVALDLAAMFGTGPQTADFDLDDPATSVWTKCRTVARASLAALGADHGVIRHKGMVALCDPDFYDALRQHASVLRASDGWEAARSYQADASDKPFSFGGISFIEAPADWVPAGKAILCPSHVDGLLKIFFAPPDHVQTVNKISSNGNQAFVHAEALSYGRGWTLVSMQSALPVVTRPNAVVVLSA